MADLRGRPNGLTHLLSRWDDDFRHKKVLGSLNTAFSNKEPEKSVWRPQLKMADIRGWPNGLTHLLSW